MFCFTHTCTPAGAVGRHGPRLRSPPRFHIRSDPDAGNTRKTEVYQPPRQLLAARPEPQLRVAMVPTSWVAICVSGVNLCDTTPPPPTRRVDPSSVDAVNSPTISPNRAATTTHGPAPCTKRTKYRNLFLLQIKQGCTNACAKAICAFKKG